MRAEVVLFIIGLILTVVYIAIYLGGSKKYSALIDGVDKDFYALSDTFVVGIAIVEKFHLNSGEKDYKKKMKIAELFSKQYLDFNYMIYRAAKISYFVLFLPIAFLLGALMKTPLMVFLGLILGVLLMFYVDMKIDSKINDQHEEILLDYPNVLSNMALLISSGMMLREAWKVVGESGTRKIYREMQQATHNISLGYSETQAYTEFADACKINEIKKFVSIICQNVEKGSSELVHVMRELSIEAWNVKKNVVKTRGSAASTKLIIPVMISFVGILMMIMVPIMSSMNMSF